MTPWTGLALLADRKSRAKPAPANPLEGGEHSPPHAFKSRETRRQ
jgi:hypothetical protein